MSSTAFSSRLLVSGRSNDPCRYITPQSFSRPRNKVVFACVLAILFLGLRHKERIFARDYGHFTKFAQCFYTFDDVIRTLPRCYIVESCIL